MFVPKKSYETIITARSVMCYFQGKFFIPHYLTSKLNKKTGVDTCKLLGGVWDTGGTFLQTGTKARLWDQDDGRARVIKDWYTG